MRQHEALLALSLLFGAGAASKSHKVDGAEFTDTYGTMDPAILFVGAGSRFKYGVVKVYAVALYMPAQAPCRDLACLTAPWSDSAELQPFQRNLHLAFHRSVDPAAVQTALVEALAPKLEADALRDFKGALEKVLEVGVKAGTALHFMCLPGMAGMRVSAALGTKTSSSISVSSLSICPALMEVYFGKDSVAPAAKDAVSKALGDGGSFPAVRPFVPKQEGGFIEEDDMIVKESKEEL